MKIACIYHNQDLDGNMSAAIVQYWFIANNRNYIINGTHVARVGQTTHKIEDDNSIDFIGYNYGQSIPDLLEYNKVIIVDISFPKDIMWKLRSNLGENLIWIDHHVSAIKENIPENHKSPVFGGIQDINYAACELTWKYFFPNTPMSELIRLLGLYDSFRYKGMDIKQIILEFQYGARSLIHNYEEAYEYLISSYSDYSCGYSIEKEIYMKGKPIYQYLCIEAKQVFKNGFNIHLYYSTSDAIPKRFICINKERFNPVDFGIDYHKDGYDGVVSFCFDGKQFDFSLYNDNEKVDCSLIAKQYGGGGHKGASSFRLNIKQFEELIKK